MMKSMNELLIGASFALVASLSYAQTSPPTETQMRDNADTQNRMANDGSDVTKRQKAYFGSLDHNHHGYLTNDDIGADPFLTQNFAKCDVDHDGKLTWDEFKNCTHNNPPTSK
jgi:hypothetical protein